MNTYLTNDLIRTVVATEELDHALRSRHTSISVRTTRIQTTDTSPMQFEYFAHSKVNKSFEMIRNKKDSKSEESKQVVRSSAQKDHSLALTLGTRHTNDINK